MLDERVTPPPRWDHRLFERSILSDYDQKTLVYSISSYFHNTTGIPHCRPDSVCMMCGSAVRLVLQAAEPKIMETVIKKIAGTLGHRNINLHPPVANDID